MSGENDPVKQPIKTFNPTGYEQTYKLERGQRLMLRMQHKHDRRMFPPRYLWRLAVGIAEVNPTYEEVPDSERRYSDPTPAIFYLNANPSKNELSKWGVEKIDDGITILCEMSEAERLRLATIFEPNKPDLWLKWRPNPGDLFFFDGRLYQVNDFRGKLYYGTSKQIATWVMPCSIFRADSAHKTFPVEAPAQDPEIPLWPLVGNNFPVPAP